MADDECAVVQVMVTLRARQRDLSVLTEEDLEEAAANFVAEAVERALPNTGPVAYELKSCSA